MCMAALVSGPIGIGRSLTAPPSHTTVRTGHVRFGKLGQLAPWTAWACQPEHHFPPHHCRFHPNRWAHAPRTRRMQYRLFFDRRLFLSFNRLSGNRSGLRAPALRLGLSVAPPFGQECLTRFACLPPTMPSADFSTVFSASYPTPSFTLLKHRGDLPG